MSRSSRNEDAAVQLMKVWPFGVALRGACSSTCGRHVPGRLYTTAGAELQQLSSLSRAT